jgi:hypothetical protein
VAVKWYSSATQLLESVCKAFADEVEGLTSEEEAKETERQLESLKRAQEQSAALAKMEEAKRLVRLHTCRKNKGCHRVTSHPMESLCAYTVSLLYENTCST